MVYVVEISFSTKSNKNVKGLADNLHVLCNKYNCIDKYNITETQEEKYNYNSVYVYCCKFDSDENDSNNEDENNSNNLFTFTEFLKQIQKHKEYKIDTVFEEDVKINVLYMSPYYIRNNMEKKDRSEYIKSQRARRYSETEYVILKSLMKKLIKEDHTKTYNYGENFNMSYNDYLNMLK